MRFLSTLYPSTFLADLGSFLAFAAGVVLISVGAWLIEPAAGLITAGVILAVCAIAYERYQTTSAARRAPGPPQE